jgi:hypothetical protein
MNSPLLSAVVLLGVCGPSLRLHKHLVLKMNSFATHMN